MPLSSPHNPVLQSIRRASREGKPDDGGHIAIEGPRLIAEALRPASKWSVRRIFTTPSGRERYRYLLETVQSEVTEVSARAFRSVSGTETTQEIIALVEPPHWSWADLTSRVGVVLVLDGIQDPGNAGTLVRSAEAFGAAGMIFSEGCVRTANGKFLRATAGSIFRLPFLEGIGHSEIAVEAANNRWPLYALTPDGRLPVLQADFRRPCALAVGSEGQGISREILACAQTLAVPTANVESLNAAVAGSIALFEAAKQRAGR